MVVRKRPERQNRPVALSKDSQLYRGRGCRAYGNHERRRIEDDERTVYSRLRSRGVVHAVPDSQNDRQRRGGESRSLSTRVPSRVALSTVPRGDAARARVHALPLRRRIHEVSRQSRPVAAEPFRTARAVRERARGLGAFPTRKARARARARAAERRMGRV